MLLWIGLAFLIVALLVMICTSWGQSHPLRKCAALSLLAHLLLAGYATTVQIVMASGNGRHGSVDVMLVDGNPDGNADYGPIDGDDPGTGMQSTSGVNSIADVAKQGTDPSDKSQTIPAASPPPLTAPPPLLEVAAKPEPKSAEPSEPQPTPAAKPEPVDVASNVASDTAKSDEPRTEPLPPPEALATLPKIPDPPTSPDGDWVSGATTGATRDVDPAPEGPANDGGSTAKVERPNSIADTANTADHNTIAVKDGTGASPDTTNTAVGPVVEHAAAPIASRATPEIYSDRTAGDRAAILRERGGSPEGESAVQSALHWLAANQSDDGRWDAGKFGAGQERRVLRSRTARRRGVSRMPIPESPASHCSHSLAPATRTSRASTPKPSSMVWSSCSTRSGKMATWPAMPKRTRSCTATAWPRSR